MLLHRRFGFCSPQKLELMLKTTQAGGFGKVLLPKNPSRTCDCATCRMTRIKRRAVYARTGLTRRNFDPQQLGDQMTAVVDIAGPFKPGVRGEKYALTLIVHQTRMVYTVTMTKKTEAGDALRQILKVIKDDESYVRYTPPAAQHPLSTIWSDCESSFHFNRHMEFNQLSDKWNSSA